MSILNLGQITSMATTFAGGRLDWALSEVSAYVDFAYREVANVVGHTPLEALATSSTTSGENRVALPPDFNYTLALTMYQGSNSTASLSNNTITWPLRQRDARWVDSQNMNGTGSASVPGIPEVYVPYGTWLELWPSPNSAYSLQLRYRVKPATLVNSTDTLVLDERWHQAVLYKTIELLEASRNNVEGEAMARNRYLNFVNTMPTDQAYKQKDRTGMGVVYKRRYD